MSRAYSLLLLLSLLALIIMPKSLARDVEEDSTLSNSNISENEDQIFNDAGILWSIDDLYTEHRGHHAHPPKHHTHPPKHHGHRGHHAHPPKHHGRHHAPPPIGF
ncbi:hypothetical protein ACS0TY_028054 [Phlomoides rotata]